MENTRELATADADFVTDHLLVGGDLDTQDNELAVRQLTELVAGQTGEIAVGLLYDAASKRLWVAGGTTGIATSPISVTTRPAANTPVLDGTISAAAQQIEPSVVTITVTSSQGESLGTGEVLDKQGHILTNDHVVAAAASFWLLALAMKALPAGTAYAVWTGIGAVGVAVLGVVLFSEAVTPWRIGGIVLIVSGIAALKLG